uniref:RNA silencing suppressor n=1 Tax=Carnation latent virus TaxID=12164 RepID=Q8JJL1_CLV|nr:putative nucleic acid binding protein [Carnation latent virus]prf//1714256B 3' Term Region ORF [Carnation latent virus]
MRERKLRKTLEDLFKRFASVQHGHSDCVNIIIAKIKSGQPGESKYAQATYELSQYARCPRCARVSPGFYFTTRCDGKTCSLVYQPDADLLEFIGIDLCVRSK